MSVKLAIAGAGGRMGRALLEAASATEGIRIVAALDVTPGRWGDLDICTDVVAAVRDADVLIDFTRPEGTATHAAACRAARRAMVIGTTGLTAGQLEQIRSLAREVPVVLAPNMSVGVNVSLKLVELAAKALGPDYDVEVFELHHKHKVDAPSGTALKLGEVAAAARGTTLEESGAFARHGNTGARKPGTIGFSAARGGDAVGDHTVYFAGTGERIEITHRSSSRATYAQGALRAAKWVFGKPAGLYDMQDVLGLK